MEGPGTIDSSKGQMPSLVWFAKCGWRIDYRLYATYINMQKVGHVFEQTMLGMIKDNIEVTYSRTMNESKPKEGNEIEAPR